MIQSPEQKKVESGRDVSLDMRHIVRTNGVPILFLALSITMAAVAGLSPAFLMNEVITRFARNSLLVLSLLIPVTAGMGLNFSIVIGAMSAQAAAIAVTLWGIKGVSGFLTACLLATPLAAITGCLAGLVLNRAKGREMITSMILGFFANGIYQLIFLFLVGSVIPFNSKSMLLPQGVGVRNTVDLINIAQSLDKIWRPVISGVRIPVVTVLVSLGMCVVITFLLRTKIGQDLRAVGQDMNIAEVMGIKVDKTRIIAMILSTVIAAWGQLVFLQNIGTLNTYNSHEQVGMFSIAALLVGGASTRRATIFQALIGVILFHTLFVVSPLAGQKLFGVPQIGEYFRVFVAYGIIAVALAIHAWQDRQMRKEAIREAVLTE
ncbi:MAG: ABC transporter permease [Bacillota bacterium]|jgi:simple sugar transport system permease protein|nr:ABC transporter permease [Bacillota bacterium]MDI9415973.1 ABC transporter permease [Bacillota bacterium]HCD41879.1 ABC transporter permease [Bacillota bacterium]HOB89218.1 ABC transporter permease [Bacillota bacterium]HOJ58447.1 ABC transporter permease [Bacillota bacterium]